METRAAFYKVASIGAMIFALTFVVVFALGYYRVAWACAAALVACAEIRVQVGGRLPRTTLFFTHLFAAVPFFIALSVLAFIFRSGLLEVLTACMGVVVFATGTVLWHRGMRMHDPEIQSAEAS